MLTNEERKSLVWWVDCGKISSVLKNYQPLYHNLDGNLRSSLNKFRFG